MCQCLSRASCFGCSPTIDRRRFLMRSGAAMAAAGGLSPVVQAPAAAARPKVRIAAVFLAQVRDSWPYPGFDAAGRQKEVLDVLAQGCPNIEFIPVTIQTAGEADKALRLCEQVDGYLVHATTLSWGLSGTLAAIGNLDKPLVVATEFLGGCGLLFPRGASMARRGVAVPVATTRLDDLVAVARQFEALKTPGLTTDQFIERCRDAYRRTFAAPGDIAVVDDDLQLAEISECVARFRQSKVLVLGRGGGGRQQDLLGATWQHVDWQELQAFYPDIDPGEAAEWAARWAGQADVVPPGEMIEPSVPPVEELVGAATVYLAMLRLLKKYDTDMITIECGGGVRVPGALPNFPCLGFMQLLDDGALGICQAKIDDSPAMVMMRLLTGRPGYVSNPVIDTSQNQIVYSHCVGPTKVFGPGGSQNGYYIRTAHSRVGAVVESLMPGGYLTTTIRTHMARKQMAIHQAKTVGTLFSEKGCRTKLVGEVCGDIGKLLHQWDYGWHRVTVYGDVKEPLTEFGKALGFEVLEEA